MHYLGIKTSDLQSLGALHTAREISQQPAFWKETWQLVADQKTRLQKFIGDSMAYDQVILTGAGTSAFIGSSLLGSYFRNFNKHTKAIPTTDLVSHPYDHLSKDLKTLVVSFARSGNSPESKAAVTLADKLSDQCHHLIITCNADGDLAKYESKNGRYVFLLPKETNDKSLAMTSSYSTMLLTGLLISRLSHLSELKKQVDLAAEYGQFILDEELGVLKKMASLPFQRAVFLGSGPLLGTANESHLKLQELTDGAVVCKHDSFLGFRHGPKAVVDSDTLIVFLLSNIQYVGKYELDLIYAMNTGKKALAQLAISEQLGIDLDTDFKIEFSKGDQKLEEDFLTLPSVLPTQILGFFKSLDLGLMPDEPSTSGAISRVVQGVNIYDLP